MIKILVGDESHVKQVSNDQADKFKSAANKVGLSLSEDEVNELATDEYNAIREVLDDSTSG